MSYKQLSGWLLLLLAVMFIAGCEEKEDVFTPKEYKVAGKVEKGPFINGSKITAQALDESYQLTGEVYQGIITEKDGSFDFGQIKLVSPYVLLTADGYYFNEVTGKLSLGQITMQALVNLTDNKNANVNVLTHLKTQRMMQLLKNSQISFDDAGKQVQKEVLKSFGLERLADKDVCNFSITSGTDEAGGLIVVSSTLLSERTDAQFTEYMAKLSTEFKSGGAFSVTTLKQLRDDATKLDLKEIEANIVDRYQEVLGVEVSVPRLDYFVDWDGDGIAGNEPNVEDENTLTLETSSLQIPVNGGSFRVKIKSKAPVTLENPNDDPDIDIAVERYLYMTSMQYDKTIEGDYLVVNVRPAGGYMIANSSIPVYSANGKYSVKLELTQEGDETKPIVFTPLGEGAIKDIVSRVFLSTSGVTKLDGYYTNCFSDQSGLFGAIYGHNLTSSNSQVQTVWADYYASLRGICEMDKFFGNDGIAEQSKLRLSFKLLKAIQYFQLASWWENPVYVKSYDKFDCVQMNSTGLFQLFRDDVASCIDRLDSGIGSLESVSSLVCPSQSAASALLAKMYLHQKSYQQAYDNLKRVINRNVYALESSATASIRKGTRELVWGMPVSNDFVKPEDVLKNNDFVPLVTYTEVLLSAAECAFRLGKEAEARDYLNLVIRARNLSVQIGNNDFIESLRIVWQSELKGFGSYFLFLRRNNLAVKVLNIKEYQQLMPIPAREIATSAINLIQNPGW